MLTPLAPADAERLQDFVKEAEFTDLGFRSRAILRELPTRRSGSGPFLADATREPTALNLLLRLFVFGTPIERETVSIGIPQPVLDILLKSGMLVAGGGVLTPTVMLTPCEDYLFAADSLPRMESGQTSDIILWTNQTTRILEMFAIRRPSGSTLDLGAGCGTISVIAAGYSKRVVATDLNARAAEFVRFNMSLNRVTNIESYTGDTFEPLAGQTFDQILANPPFFVTPSSSRLFCENPMDLDQFCRRVVRESAAHLNEGGFLQMVFEWVQVKGESWKDRLAEWLEGTGCDAWVLRTYIGDAGAYAMERTRDEYAVSPERATAKFTEWTAYYREQEVEQVCGGLLAMRKRSGSNWLRIEEAQMDPIEPFGGSILDIFATQTLLSAHPSDEQLMAVKPQLLPATRLDQQFSLNGNKWAPASIKLSLPGALPASLAVETDVATFLARCDGARTLGELAQELAAAVKAPPEQVRQQCCAVVRRLAERRFVRFC